MLRHIFASIMTFVGIMMTFVFWYMALALQPKFVEWQRDPINVWLIMAIWAILGGLSCFFMARHIADWAMKVERPDADQEDADLTKARQALERAQTRLKLANGPELGIYEGPEINAFIAGPRMRNSTLALSRGAIQQLNIDDLEILISRELLQFKSGDLKTLAFMQGMLFAFTLYVARMLAFLLGTSLRQTEEELTPSYGVEMLVTTVLLMVLTLPGTLIFWFYSRSSTLRADKAVADFFGPSAYAAFLGRLAQHPPRPEIFSDAFKLQSQTYPAWLQGLSLQPSLAYRIRYVGAA